MSTERVISLESLIADVDKWATLTRDFVVNVEGLQKEIKRVEASGCDLQDYFHQRAEFDRETLTHRKDLTAAFMP